MPGGNREHLIAPYVASYGAMTITLCDSVSTRPTSGMSVGDLAFLRDTGLWYVATSASVWTLMGGAAHPDLATHDALGLATDAELAAHATDAGLHSGSHPNLATHDALGLATDTELSTAISDHVAAMDPHTGYELDANKGAAFGYAPLDSGAKVPLANLPANVISAGVIVMWSGLLVNIPSGWALCDGVGGRPDLRSKFIKGAAAGVDPGTTGGAATHTHTGHSAHVVTQPADHSISAHAGSAVAAHVFTQSANHSNHVFTQPANHVFTQPAAHSNHVFTQPSGHSAHAALATHVHELPFIKVAGGTGVLRMLASSIFGTGTSRTPESVSAAPTANATAAAVELSQAITGGTPDAHSAHAGGAVDAHSAHASGAVDAHASGAVDAHSAHSGGAVDAHGVTQPSAHSGLSHSATAVDAHSAHDTPNSEPAFYSLAYIIKT